MICNGGGKQLQNSIFGASNRYLKLKFGVIICMLNIAMLSGRVHKVASCSIICMHHACMMVLRLAGGEGGGWCACAPYAPQNTNSVNVDGLVRIRGLNRYQR